MKTDLPNSGPNQNGPNQNRWTLDRRILMIAGLCLSILAGPLLVWALTSESPEGRSPEDYHTIWESTHLSRIDPSKVRHADLVAYLRQLQAEGVKVVEVGRSVAGREIYQMEFGEGPERIFLWSQMHGDEPTATSALIDLFHYWQANRNDPVIAEMARRMTIRAVPMLNPDGAELFQRRNLQSIDINRDARRLVTPEGQLLKKLRDEWQPVLGFNLHNQNTRTAVGTTGKQATISLLAVAHDEARSDPPGRVRAKQVCSTLHTALSRFIPGQIGRYDDSFNPRAFGDLISQWGTPVVLIETGGWAGQTEMELVRLNFVGLAWTLQELVSGAVDRADPAIYDAIPYNNSGVLVPLMVRRATVIQRAVGTEQALPPYQADLAINLERTRATIQDVGDLEGLVGLEEVSAEGFHVTTSAAGGLRVGGEATLLFYRSQRAASIDWDTPGLERRSPPDAVFRQGRWTGRERLITAPRPR